MIGSLNFFRFVSIIFIALFHAYGKQDVLRNGYIFVEFFFILSGFLTLFSIQKHNLTFSKFIVKKFWRLYPIFIILDIINIVVRVYLEEKIKVPNLVNTILFTSYGFFPNKPPIISWFCPALFWGSLAMCPLIFSSKINTKAKMLITFLISVILYSIILFTTNKLSGVNYEYLGFIYKGTLRAIAGISLGLSLKYLLDISLFKINKNKLQILEIISLLLFIVSFCFVNNGVLFPVLSIISFYLIILVFSQNITFISKF